MFANSLRILMVALATVTCCGGVAAFADVPAAVHDAHRLQTGDEFQSTLEARCTICHTRARVDAAISQQEDLDALLQRMIERGAILSERDKKVLGTFWGSPLKEGDAANPPLNK